MPKYVKKGVKKSTKRKAYRKKAYNKNSLVTKTQLYRAIRRNVETKIASNSTGWITYNSSIGSAGDRLTLLPSIAQGTAQNQRIGNSIKPLKLVIRGYVAYNAQQSSANLDARMLGVRMFVYQDKIVKNYSNGINNWQLLDLGGTSGSFDGTPINFNAPHNNDMFIFYADKRFKILKPYGYTNTTTPSTTVTLSSVDNSMYHPFTITLTRKHLPSVLKFDATEDANFPINFAPYFSLGYCDLLNNSADAIITQVGASYVATLYYEDA